MTCFTILVMLPGMASGPIYGKYIRKLNKAMSDMKAESSAIAEEAFANIRTVKAFATEDRECSNYAVKNDEIFKICKKQATAYGFFNLLMQFIQFGSLDALVYFAAWLNSKGGITVGQFTSFQFYMFSFLMNFMMVTSVVGEVMGVAGTTQALAQIFLYEQKINSSGGEQVTAETIEEGTITLKDIKFTYPTKPDIQVISEANIVVEKNKTVALVGSSGCGKSTIIQLVERFYDPDEGTVSYGN